MESQEHSDSPPPYSPSEDFEYSFDEGSKEQLLWPPQSDEPGVAVASSLVRGLQVPSRTATCTSGFDYPEELIQYRITKDDWSQFTQVICDEAKLSRQQWTTVIGKGLGTFAIGGLMIGFLGAIPAVFVARNSRKRQEKRNLVAALAGEQGKRLSRHISQWNETFFQPRGILIRVDLPDQYLGDMDDMELHKGSSAPRSDSKARDKAALKARVVIIPLEDGASVTSGPSST